MMSNGLADPEDQVVWEKLCELHPLRQDRRLIGAPEREWLLEERRQREADLAGEEAEEDSAIAEDEPDDSPPP